MQTRYLCGLKRVSHAERLPNVARSVRRLFGCGCVKPTFNLPNFTNFGPWQSGTLSVGTKGLGSVPNILGNLYLGGDGDFSPSGVFYKSTVQTIKQLYTNRGDLPSVRFDASRSSILYSDNATRITPAFTCIKYCIKY